MDKKTSIIIEKEIITGGRTMRLPNNSVINRYCHVLAGAEIGHDVMIGENCYISRDVKIGNYTRIQNGNNLYDGLTIGDRVFIAPVVGISNHHDPRIRDGKFEADPVWIKDGATIGINSTIIAPCIIGENAFVAGGAVVLRNIADNEKYISLYKDRYQSGLVNPKGKK